MSIPTWGWQIWKHVLGYLNKTVQFLYLCFVLELNEGFSQHRVMCNKAWGRGSDIHYNWSCDPEWRKMWRRWIWIWATFLKSIYTHLHIMLPFRTIWVGKWMFECYRFLVGKTCTSGIVERNDWLFLAVTVFVDKDPFSLLDWDKRYY